MGDLSDFIVDFQNIIGMTLQEAAAYLSQWNYKVRAVKKDGNPLVVTRDFQIMRYNVELVQGHIAKIAGRG